MSRILNLHSAEKSINTLIEQEVTNYDSVYDYKKEGNLYFTKKKTSDKWIKATGKVLDAIKSKVFNSPDTTKGETTKTGEPFKTKEEGDRFRTWMNKYYKSFSKRINLDVSGSHTNSYIRKAYNSKLKSGKTFGEYYQEKNSNREVSKGNPLNKRKSTIPNLFVSDTINSNFLQKINFKKLESSSGKIDHLISNPGTKECAQFINDFSDKFDSVGNAWLSYRNDSILGPTIFSKFKQLDDTQIKTAISLWQELDENGGGKEGGNVTGGKVKSFVKGLVNGGESSPTDLQIDDIIGLYYDGSSHHEEAFYHGGVAWFVDGKPGKTISNGDGWGMNTHLGIVGAIQDGIPLIFHNVSGNVISQPVSELSPTICWIKRSGTTTKQVKVSKKNLSEYNDINEQRPDHLMPGQPETNPNSVVFKVKEETKQKIKSVNEKYNCVNEDFRVPLDTLIEEGYDTDILKLSLGIIGRESTFASGLRYNTISPIKIIGAYLGADTSVGPAQMKTETAEELGLDLSYILTNVGALSGVYQYLHKSIKKARTEGYGETPSSIGDIGTGNAMYDISIASYNIGRTSITKWCDSKDTNRNLKNLKDKCNGQVDGKGEEVKNYIPNFKSERWDGVKTSTHGYIKEVAERFKGIKCI